MLRRMQMPAGSQKQGQQRKKDEEKEEVTSEYKGRKLMIEIQ